MRRAGPTGDESEAVSRVLEALHSAKKRAGMSVGPKPGKPDTAQGRAILRKLRELDEPDPVPLLCAVMHAKVERDARSDDPERRAGRWCNGVTITRDSWWESNLDAGRRYLLGPTSRPQIAYGAMAERLGSS